MSMERQSTTLCSILDKIGVTDDVRNWFKEAADSLDELEFLQLELYGKLPSSLDIVKTVGSFSEGTFRTSYNSDRDILNPHPDIEVVENIDSVSCSSYCVLEYLPLKPGFVHLQVPTGSLASSQKRVKTCLLSGETYLQHYTIKEGLFNVESNGPAERNRRVFCEIDNVHCFRCPWPSIANDWLQRPRPHAWPSEETRALLQSIPCVVVQSGHPDSACTERALEWRLSFTLQENHLMCQLNDTQFKCYVLLKMIKEDLVTEACGKSLTSYHCKTALFYTIEQNPVEIWKPEKLVPCLVLCLNQLLQWLDRKFCPNFFMPDVDLFLGKVEKSIMPNIGRILDDVISNPIQQIKTLSSSNFGEMYRFAYYLDGDNDEMKALELEAKKEIIETVHGVFVMLNFLVDSIVDYCLARAEQASKLQDMNIPLAFWLVTSQHLAFYDKLETMMGKLVLRFHVLPVMYANLASHLFDMAMKTKDTTLRDWFVCASALNYMYAINGNEKVVANLKLANVLFISGHTQSAKWVLDYVKYDIESRKIPLMTKEEAKNMPMHSRLLNALHRMAESGLEAVFTFPMCMLFTRFAFRPIVFLRSELDITPKALVFEAFRSMGTEAGSRFEGNFWYDRATLDAVSFYTFLRFLVEGETSSFHDLFGQMDEIKFGNGVTYLNLLGWVTKEEEDIEMAASLFLESWKQNMKEIKSIQKQNIWAPPTIYNHNAAKLHMLLLIYEQWKTTQY